MNLKVQLKVRVHVLHVTCVDACTGVFCPHGLLQYTWAKCMAVCHTLVDVCVCMSYSQGSDDKPGGGTQV